MVIPIPTPPSKWDTIYQDVFESKSFKSWAGSRCLFHAPMGPHQLLARKWLSQLHKSFPPSRSVSGICSADFWVDLTDLLLTSWNNLIKTLSLSGQACLAVVVPHLCREDLWGYSSTIIIDITWPHAWPGSSATTLATTIPNVAFIHFNQV